MLDIMCMGNIRIYYICSVYSNHCNCRIILTKFSEKYVLTYIIMSRGEGAKYRGEKK